MNFKQGERALIKFAGREATATVVMASENGRSLLLSFPAMLGGYLGMMPVLDEFGNGDFRDLMTHQQVEISRMQ